MNSTSQNPGQKFPLGPEPNAMDNKTLIATLAVSTSIAFVFTLLLYAVLSGRNPIPPRLHYGVLMSVLPALGVLLVYKLSRAVVSLRGAVMIYLMLFILLLVIQAFGRMIPVY